MTGQHADHDQTWRRFTTVTAGAVGAAVVIGLALSYASLYRVAYNAGYDNPWLTWGDTSVRPAHLFPLTLDLPILVGYAGRIVLAGRRSAVWATGVLVACSVGTVAAQVVDGANWVAEHRWVQATIHGWPPLSVFLTLHLLVMILQALGYLVPPVQERPRPSWPARAWAWARRLRADIDTAPATATPGAWVDMGADIRPDIAAGASLDIRPDSDWRAGVDARGGDIALTSGMSTPRGGAHLDSAGGARGGAGVDTDMDTDASAGGRAGSNVTPMRARRAPRAGVDTAPDAGGDAGVDIDDDARADIVARVRSGELSRAAAAREVGRHPKTVARWVADAEGAEEAAR